MRREGQIVAQETQQPRPSGGVEGPEAEQEAQTTAKLKVELIAPR